MKTYSCADGKMTTEAHACRANASCASGKREEIVYGGIGVGIVRLESLIQVSRRDI
jgi:hypothetical protein